MPLTKNILIVDDNKKNRQVLSKILCSQYNIIEAENGKEALEILNHHYKSISVILLDIVMPVMNGYELLAELRSDAFLSNIPVIVTSGNEEIDIEVNALSLGAHDFIQKPYLPDVIKHRVANTIYLRETACLISSVQKDALTGLYSKEYFYRLVEEILHNNPDKKYDIICADIERFKLVNELYGTKEGDALLRYVANMLQDKVQDLGICGRIGGDVFAIIIDHQEEYEEEFFLESIEYINKLNASLNCVIKYGIYAIEDRTLPANIMCDRACLAVESIKGKYGTYCAFYDDTIRQKLLHEQFILSNMKSALTNKEFVVFYQPKFDLMTEAICSAEALVRWFHPEKGMIPPNEFIEIFENNGFITELDLYVWEEACKWIRSWIDRGNAPVPVSINMSRADIYNPNIDKILLDLLGKYKLNPSHIYLEITETAYTENSEQMVEVVSRLKKLGFLIEMDDFGSGYSSLNMLSELPIDVIKLDMRFVQNQDSSRNKRSIMSFVISLAKWMNLMVVAEGVETEEQVNLLKVLGCQRVQGYYFSKPLPLDSFEELIFRVNSNNADNNKPVTISQLPNDRPRLSSNKKNMVIFDWDSQEYEAFEKVFANKYNVKNMSTTEETQAFIHKEKSKIAILIFAVTPNISMDQITNVVTLCKQYDIPVITIHSSIELMGSAVSLGVLDCILKPYAIETLNNTVENTLCRMKVVQFQKEVNINDAIVEMKKRAEVDFLSGLLNRSELKMQIQDFYSQQGSAGVFILIDIDHFKSINVALGYGVGDKVLCAVGEMLVSIFNETTIISRMNSDLFAVFIPFEIEKQELERKLDKVCHTIAYDNANLNLTLTCSVGVCFSPDHGTNFEDLYNHADIALLNAKKEQNESYVIYEDGMKAPVNQKLEEQALKLLDDVSDAMFVCDAITSEIIYINDTACKIIKKPRNSCIGARCYQLFWDSCKNCDFCFQVNNHALNFYEEDAYLKDGKTKVHLKAKVGEWDGKKVKIHYLQSI
ncbi:EAL domain-containing protein [Anaerotignum sp. MB30-C6]|uniref:EAL domain-containing protein n=1 Tax=Anaerotignum sp. MB30-C6 TaxID=3070814 RepID=UPI0027DDCC0C|nr:EAL domain-containing protein [Anaerotignum sp. MB30-C6]WMI79831.1 EAL domain-containing protein [Anaerotignum sp. MB30-C6]